MVVDWINCSLFYKHGKENYIDIVIPNPDGSPSHTHTQKHSLTNVSEWNKRNHLPNIEREEQIADWSSKQTKLIKLIIINSPHGSPLSFVSIYVMRVLNVARLDGAIAVRKSVITRATRATSHASSKVFGKQILCAHCSKTNEGAHGAGKEAREGAEKKPKKTPDTHNPLAYTYLQFFALGNTHKSASWR